MKAFITSIGEKTTKICCEQLSKFGFEIILLDEIEPWINKYKKFINMANEDCLRVDADIIVNEQIKLIGLEKSESWMRQYTTYDLYQNRLKSSSPVFYKKEAIELIRKHLNTLNSNRPETAASRLKGMPQILTSDLVVGMHGFFQDEEAVKRAKANKINRKQIQNYDFDLTFKIINL